VNKVKVIKNKQIKRKQCKDVCL